MIVDTEMVLREADGPVESGSEEPASGGKVIALGCVSVPVCRRGARRSQAEQFEGRIIFMSIYNDTVRGERGNTEKCITNSVTVTNYARRFLLGRWWSFMGPGSEKKWCGTCSDKPDGKWDRTDESMMLNFAESGHPIFRATSALERGELRSKENGKKSIHFDGSEETIELILRTIISVNQLSIYGAVADLCKESMSKDSEVAEKLAANDDLESMEILAGLPVADPHTNAELQ